jgi:thioester reductase-like protein
MNPSSMSDAEIGAELARLRQLKDETTQQLRALVRESDDRAALARIEADHPGLAKRLVQRIAPDAIVSAEIVGGGRI